MMKIEQQCSVKKLLICFRKYDISVEPLMMILLSPSFALLSPPSSGGLAMLF